MGGGGIAGSLELDRTSPGGMGGCCRPATQLNPSEHTNEMMDRKIGLAVEKSVHE